MRIVEKTQHLILSLESRLEDPIVWAKDFFASLYHHPTRPLECRVSLLKRQEERRRFKEIMDTFNRDSRDEVVEILNAYPQKSRIRHAESLVALSGGDRYHLLYTLSGYLKRLPEEKRERLLTFAPLYKSAVDVDQVYFLAQSLPDEQVFREHIPTILEIPIDPIEKRLVREYLLKTIEFVPPQMRAHYIEEAKKDLDWSLLLKPSLSFACAILERIDPQYHRQLHPYFEAHLKEIETLKVPLRNFCTLLVNAPKELGLELEDPIIEKAVGYLYITAESKTKNDPYVLYGHLKSLEGRKIPITRNSVQIRGKRVSFAPQCFEGKCVDRVLRSEIPFQMTPQEYRKWMEELVLRFPADREIFESVEGIYWENVFDDQKSLSGMVRSPEWQYMCIVRYLRQHPEHSVGMIGSIYSCGTGKSEGIRRIYNLLPPEFRIREKVDPEEVERAKGYLQHLFTQILEDQISERNPFMEEVVGEEMGFNQLTHYTTYLRNLLGSTLGLADKVTFDPGTLTMDLKTVEMPPEEILESFFRHLTPKTFLKKALSLVKRDLKNLAHYPSLHNDLYALSSKGWKLNSKSNCHLTEKGLLDMLIAANIFEEHEAKRSEASH